MSLCVSVTQEISSTIFEIWLSNLYFQLLMVKFHEILPYFIQEALKHAIDYLMTVILRFEENIRYSTNVHFDKFATFFHSSSFASPRKIFWST